MFEKIKRNDLIDQAIKRGVQEERELPEETILLETSHPNLLQQRILELNQVFNLTDFLMGDSDIETAIGLITPSQALFLECKLVDTDNHAYNFQALYDAIYDSKITIIPIKNIHTWQELVMGDGNIAIQLTKFGDLYIWCPKQITDFQMASLRKISECLKSIHIFNPEVIDQVFLDIHAWIGKEEGGELSLEINQLSLDTLLDYYKNSDLKGSACSKR